MDLREYSKFIACDVPSGRVFCSDCGDQITYSCGSMICPTCNKSGYAEPELDADDSLFSIADEDGERFYARVYSRTSDDIGLTR
jgi:hypothetical protein